MKSGLLNKFDSIKKIVETRLLGLRKNNLLGNEIVIDRETQELETIPFDEKLKKLEAFKDQALISNDEYNAKRKKILNEKWCIFLELSRTFDLIHPVSERFQEVVRTSY